MERLDDKVEDCLATKKCFQYQTENKQYCLLTDESGNPVPCKFYSIGAKLKYKILTEIFYYYECRRPREEFIKKMRRDRNGNLAEG